MFHKDLGMRIDLIPRRCRRRTASRRHLSTGRRARGPSPVTMRRSSSIWTPLPDGDIGPVVPPPSNPVKRWGGACLPQGVTNTRRKCAFSPFMAVNIPSFGVRIGQIWTHLKSESTLCFDRRTGRSLQPQKGEHEPNYSPVLGMLAAAGGAAGGPLAPRTAPPRRAAGDAQISLVNDYQTVSVKLHNSVLRQQVIRWRSSTLWARPLTVFRWSSSRKGRGPASGCR